MAVSVCLSMELRVPAQEPTLACHAAPAQPQSNGAGDELSCEDIQSLLHDPLQAQQVSHHTHPIFHRLDHADSETDMQGLADLRMRLHDSFHMDRQSSKGRPCSTLTLTPRLIQLSQAKAKGCSTKDLEATGADVIDLASDDSAEGAPLGRRRSCSSRRVRQCRRRRNTGAPPRSPAGIRP